MTPLRALHAAARLVAVAMFACVFAIFCLKIAARYVAHDTMAWADEVSILLFMWIVFWSNALLLRERDHIRFDLVTVLLPPAAQRASAILRALILGGIFLYALPATTDYVLFLWRERTPVLGIRLDQAYACFILFTAAVVVRAAIDVVLLLSPRWRTHV